MPAGYRSPLGGCNSMTLRKDGVETGEDRRRTGETVCRVELVPWRGSYGIHTTVAGSLPADPPLSLTSGGRSRFPAKPRPCPKSWSSDALTAGTDGNYRKGAADYMIYLYIRQLQLPWVRLPDSPAVAAVPKYGGWRSQIPWYTSGFT